MIFNCTCNMSFKQRRTNFITRHSFEEIVVHYDNLYGDVGVNVRRSSTPTNQKQETTFFPGVFRGLKRFLRKEALFYLNCQSKIGLALTYEYLGGIPSLPSPAPSSSHSKLFLSLQKIVRFQMIRNRARSPLADIARHSLHLNAASFHHEFYIPAIVALPYGHPSMLVHPITLARKWSQITSGENWRYFLRYQQNLKYTFVDHFQTREHNADTPNTMLEVDTQIANHFSFQFYDYLDAYFQSKERGDLIVHSRTRYQQEEDEKKQWEKHPVS